MHAGIAVQLALDSIAAAAIYGLMALAVALAFSGSGTLHLAIGQVGIAGGLVAASALSAGVPAPLAVVAGLALGGVLSTVAERTLVEPAVGRPLLGAVLLLGAAVVLREVLQALFQRPAYAFPSTGGTFLVAGGIVHDADLVTIAVVVATSLGGVAVLRLTTLGAALRLTAAAPHAAERIGVDTARVRALAFGAGGAIATAAVLLGVARFPLAASGGVALALRGIAAAAAAGFRSPTHVIAASLTIGAVQVVGTYYLGSGGEAIADAVAVLLIAVGWRR